MLVLLGLYNGLGIGNNDFTKVKNTVRGLNKRREICPDFFSSGEGEYICRRIDIEVNQVKLLYPRLTGDYQAELGLGSSVFGDKHLLSNTPQPVSFELTLEFLVDENVYFHPRNDST